MWNIRRPEKAGEYQAMGQFKPGQSGNPAGKPKGSSRAAKLRALLDPHAAALIKKAVELAKKGDTTALRLCLERLLPAMKAEGRAVVIPGLAEAPDLTGQARAVLSALAQGVISADQANVLLQAIAAQARIIEVDELARRIERLEGASK
jgi:Family of unknown function (DUF5681)